MQAFILSCRYLRDSTTRSCSPKAFRLCPLQSTPYEILQPGGSIEYSNDEAGAVWMRRMLDTYPKAIWLNPEPAQLWPYR